MPSKNPESDRSSIVVGAIFLFIVALGAAVAALFVPVAAPFAIVTGLGAVMLAVLSLREL